MHFRGVSKAGFEPARVSSPPRYPLRLIETSAFHIPLAQDFTNPVVYTVTAAGMWCSSCTAPWGHSGHPAVSAARRGEEVWISVMPERSVLTNKRNPATTGFPFWFQMVPKAGFEPARVSPPPPQDGVSASSTTSARCRKNILIHAPLENQDEESGWGVRRDRRRAARSHPANPRSNVFLPKSPASLYSFPGNLFP